MKDDASTTAGSHTLNDLCAFTGLSARTIRYYIQSGLVARPVGETRAARYSNRHLEDLLSIRKWSDAGLSLERIRELLHGETPDLPPRAPAPGSITVCSHLHIGEGLELVIDPGRAGLSPEQLRLLNRLILDAYRHVQSDDSGDSQTHEEFSS